MDDKKIKKRFLKNYRENPEGFYPVKTLKKLNFKRNKCKSCGKFFWNINPDRDICGDPNCTGGYKFIDNSPAKNKLNYIETWKSFSSYFEKLGYKKINRYPVLALWRDDIPFVEASIDDFIPHVVEGQSKPPSKSLVVPQLCLRFNDLDNVGFTGAHYSLFSMIGQHRFEEPKDFDPDLYLYHLLNWFKKYVGLDFEEMTLHEDIWAGSGKFGPCVELFSRGLELANQVYMQYQVAPDGDGYKELDLKVLDMGMGHERIPWFTHGESTSYKTTFPEVIKKMQKIIGLKDEKFFKRFLPFASYLNVDEVEDINKTWLFVASKMGLELDELKNKIVPLANLYALAEHARAVLVGISDGALPSNVGGGYNLRILLRRCLEIIRKYDWNISLEKICKWHSEELKRIYPELSKNLDTVYEVLEVEKNKWAKNRKRARKVLEKLKGEHIDEKKLLKLYDSQGIGPEILKEEGFKNILEDFYKKASKLHQKEKREVKKDKLEIPETKKTKPLYLKDYKKTEFKAKILDIIKGKYIILDRTAFYPESGGQKGDRGYIKNSRVINTFKQGDVIIHEIKGKAGFSKGENVKSMVDKNRRLQLTQNHTATHIINLASRKVLGKHVRQAGAEKTTKKGRIDITHYELPSSAEIDKIEYKANKIVKDDIKVNKEIMERDEAEKKYGFDIYQGGAVPGKELRIISIGKDHEACGGTHLNHTGEANIILITNVKKIQDAVVRIEFISGGVAENTEEKAKKDLDQLKMILGKGNILKNVKKLKEEKKRLQRKKKGRKKEKCMDIIKNLNFKEKNGVKVLIDKIEGDMEDLKKISEELSDDNTLILIFSKKHFFVSAGEKVLEKDINVKDIISKVCDTVKGKGGGSERLGQGYCGLEPNKNIIKNLEEWLNEKLQNN